MPRACSWSTPAVLLHGAWGSSHPGTLSETNRLWHAWAASGLIGSKAPSPLRKVARYVEKSLPSWKKNDHSASPLFRSHHRSGHKARPMTTAHRPTWAPAKGHEEQGGARMFGPSKKFSKLDDAAHTVLKTRCVPHPEFPHPPTTDFAPPSRRGDRSALASRERPRHPR